MSGEATSTSSDAPSVEALLEDGLFLVGASPVHLAIRGTPTAGSVRCAWRGSARTAEQRADAIRLWLGLGAGAAIPDAAYVEALFMVVLDTFDPRLRETAKANFRAIARGGESRDYLFLTCFADYAVTAFLLGSGTTPATVTVAYDRRGEAEYYDLAAVQAKDRYNAYGILVHEGGHALGISGTTRSGGIGDRVHHSQVEDSVMTTGGIDACTPTPFDVMALYALYQTVD